ncbi:restriction endonuclease subunit S, partial [Mesomycoplasma ovipneumoniae]
MGYYKEFLAENIITWTADGVNAGFVNFRKGKFFATSHCGMLISKKYPENEFFAIAIGLRSKKWVSRSIVPCLKTDDIAQVELKFTTDISEQQKISQLFDTFENLVKKLEEKIHLLKDLKNNLTKKMFTDLSLDFPLIRFKGLTQPWKTEQISDLFQTYKNKNSNNLKLIS